MEVRAALMVKSLIGGCKSSLRAGTVAHSRTSPIQLLGTGYGRWLELIWQSLEVISVAGQARVIDSR